MGSTRPAARGGLTLEESARRLGHYRWTEMRLFEALGSWVATVPEPGVKLVLGRHCFHHAWHAELWRERLPELPELPELGPDRLTRPPNDAYAAFVDAWADPNAAGATIEKLVGIYRVLLPRKIAAYTAHRQEANALADAPTIRALRFVLQDELDDWREGEALLQSLLDTPEKVARAARRHQALEAQLLAAGGGIAGAGGADGGGADPLGLP